MGKFRWEDINEDDDVGGIQKIKKSDKRGNSFENREAKKIKKQRDNFKNTKRF